MIKSRINYWSCSKFADFIRGEKKPLALEWGEWDEWHENAKKKRPFRHWLAENGLKKLQNFFMFPIDIYRTIKYYIINRYIDKTHYLKTGLIPGQYHELDERILHGLFNELVDFVEIESAAWSSEKFKGRRNAKIGVNHLKWASELVYDAKYLDKNDKRIGKPTDQATSAKEILELYNWWLERPNRPDIHDISGWSDYCKTEKEKGYEINKEGKIALKKMRDLEEKYDKEDEKMLIRLIKIRRHLWT